MRLLQLRALNRRNTPNSILLLNANLIIYVEDAKHSHSLCVIHEKSRKYKKKKKKKKSKKVHKHRYVKLLSVTWIANKIISMIKNTHMCNMDFFFGSERVCASVYGIAVCAIWWWWWCWWCTTQIPTYESERVIIWHLEFIYRLTPLGISKSLIWL